MSLKHARISRLFDLLPYQNEVYPKKDCIAAKVEGKWKTYATREVLEQSDRASLALKRLGVQKGDRVALISMNRPEWNFIDLGILQIGAVNVPIYPTSSDEELIHILKHCEAQVAFIEERKNLARVLKFRDRCPQLQRIYALDPKNASQDAPHWLEILPESDDPELKTLQPLKDAVQPEDLASIIYTSGTTGTPKGVMLEHRNILSNVLHGRGLLPLDPSCRALSFLPLCHIFERMVNYVYMYLGVSIYYAENIGTIAENLKEAKPMIFVTVPRLLEKVYQKIAAKGEALEGAKRKMFDWSMKLAHRYDPDAKPTVKQALEIEVARSLVFSKWREALGGNVRCVITGGAALQGHMARAFAAAGIPVLQGYGLTETSAMCTVNRAKRELSRLGTVGPAVGGVEIRIQREPDYPDGEGEILIRGQHVMRGYYKDEAATREAIDADGWFHTGDIGTLVEGIFLKITDRKKEMFKTSGGKYVTPLSIEGRLKSFPLIEQAMVVGENRKFPSALIVPDKAALKEWCRGKGIAVTDSAEMLKHPEVDRLFKTEIQKTNRDLGSWEQIKKFALIGDEWGTATGELTPKLSLKRKVIQKKYADVIEGFYQEGLRPEPAR